MVTSCTYGGTIDSGQPDDCNDIMRQTNYWGDYSTVPYRWDNSIKDELDYLSQISYQEITIMNTVETMALQVDFQPYYSDDIYISEGPYCLSSVYLGADIYITYSEDSIVASVSGAALAAYHPPQDIDPDPETWVPSSVTFYEDTLSSRNFEGDLFEGLENDSYVYLVLSSRGGLGLQAEGWDLYLEWQQSDNVQTFEASTLFE